MYRGRYRLGEEPLFTVLCVNNSGVPVEPDTAPTLRLYASDGTAVTTKTLPAIDRYARTGLFGLRLYLGADFALGQYLVLYQYSVSATAKGAWDRFEVVGGGHKDGAVLAMAYFHRPNADFIVQQLTSGKIQRGRNPRV
jgi:hypothetical protein